MAVEAFLAFGRSANPLSFEPGDLAKLGESLFGKCLSSYTLRLGSLSLTSRFLGGILCLAGGYVIGYASGAQSILQVITNAIDYVINSISFLKTIADQLSSIEWYLAVSLILFLLGLILIVRRTGNSVSPKLQPGSRRPVNPGACKFCGADMKGSKTYCPVCGRSQV